MSNQISMRDSLGGAHGGAPEAADDSPSTEPIDWYNLIASERGMPAGWQWFTIRGVDGGVLVKGAVCTTLYKSGPRKGEENWRKRDRSTERELLIASDALAARRLQWERDTGRCAQCFGSGKEPCGWSQSEGRLTRPCGRCKTTGEAQ